MAIAMPHLSPVAHVPWVLGVVRTRNVAALSETFCPPHPAPVRACGRGVEARLLAMLDGHHARYTVGARREERGMSPLLQPGLTRASLQADRLGQSLDALFAAPLTRVFGAIALNALEVEALSTPWLPQDTGWPVLATTRRPAVCTDVAILQAYQEQHITVAPGVRWIQPPAALSPVWLEQPARLAALALLTVVGLRVSAVIQRQVRVYLRDQHQQGPGQKGPTATPTAAVVCALFAPGMLVHCVVEHTTSLQGHGVQDHHRLLCEAVGIDPAWYHGVATEQNALPRTTPP